MGLGVCSGDDAYAYLLTIFGEQRRFLTLPRVRRSAGGAAHSPVIAMHGKDCRHGWQPQNQCATGAGTPIFPGGFRWRGREVIDARTSC